MSRRFGALLAGLTLLAALAGCGGSSTAASDGLGTIAHYTDIGTPGLAAPSGSVAEDDGTRWSYAHPAPGHITLLYFGYTSCPDVCPLTMADISAALTRVPPAVRDKVWVQFVSTDPHRDTAAQITRWLGRYNPSFHGGRAPIASVVAAARAYGIYIKAPKVSSGDYRVSHGASLVVLDQQGAAVGLFTELAGPASYAQALPELVSTYAG